MAAADYAGVVFIEPAGWLVWGAGTSSRLNAVTNSPQRVGGQQGGGLKRRRLEHRTSLIPTYPGTLDNRVGKRRAQLAAEDPHKRRCFVYMCHSRRGRDLGGGAQAALTHSRLVPIQRGAGCCGPLRRPCRRKAGGVFHVKVEA